MLSPMEVTSGPKARVQHTVALCSLIRPQPLDGLVTYNLSLDPLTS